MKKYNEITVIEDFCTLMIEGYNNGWHELNGGNLTYRLTESEIATLSHLLDMDNRLWQPLNFLVSDLANEIFLVTGSGRYFKDAIKRTEETIGIIQINDKGNEYRICWGLSNSKPTSELSSHLLNHETKKRTSNGENRVIYHAHTTNLIALTFVLPLDSIVFTRELWEMATECPIVFPNGVGIVDWMVPGGNQIGLKSSELMEKHDIIVWAHHGTFCSGKTLAQTFGIMETVEKSAEILVKVLSMTNKKVQTIELENFKDLAKSFNVNLDEKYLYQK